MLIVTLFYAVVFVLLCCGIALIISGYRRRSISRIITGVFFNCVILFFAVTIINITMAFSWSGSEHTDPREYQRILGELHGLSNDIAHFPPTIPEDAFHVHLYYLPHLLQGGLSLQLRYQTNSQQIEQLYTRFTSQQHKIVHSREGLFELMSQTSDSPPPPGNIRTGVFPDDYCIKQLSPNDQGLNHGVAISKTRHEIVYRVYGGGG